MTMTKQPLNNLLNDLGSTAINAGKDSLSSLAENFIKDKDMRGNT
jgi:hypothetical protein